MLVLIRANLPSHCRHEGYQHILPWSRQILKRCWTMCPLICWCNGHRQILSPVSTDLGLTSNCTQALNDIAEVADAGNKATLDVILDRRQHGTQSLLLPGLAAMQGAALFIRIPGP